MNSCSTRYAQNPPSLVLSLYSCCPSSYYQLTLPSLFFNLVVRSTIELQLQSLSFLGWICCGSNDSQASNNPHYTKEQSKGSDGWEGIDLLSSIWLWWERENRDKGQVFGSHNLLGFCQLVDVNYGFIS